MMSVCVSWVGSGRFAGWEWEWRFFFDGILLWRQIGGVEKETYILERVR